MPKETSEPEEPGPSEPDCNPSKAETSELSLQAPQESELILDSGLLLPVPLGTPSSPSLVN